PRAHVHGRADLEHEHPDEHDEVLDLQLLEDHEDHDQHEQQLLLEQHEAADEHLEHLDEPDPAAAPHVEQHQPARAHADASHDTDDDTDDAATGVGRGQDEPVGGAVVPKESVPPDLLPPDADALIGGPLGRHASPRERSVGRLLPFVVAMTVVPMGIAVLRQGHCIAHGWNGDEQFWRMCFSDLPAQYQLACLAGGLTGWLDGSALTEQMPLLSGLMALLGGMVPDGGWLVQTRVYFLLWAIVLAVCAAVTVRCVGLLR